MANNNHFELTLDTIAPTGGITRASEFINGNKTVADQFIGITYDGNPTAMKVWHDTVETGTKGDGYAAATWEEPAAYHATNFSGDNNYYYHLVLMDDVGNESPVYNTEVICYDTTKPTVNSVALDGGAEITKTRNIDITFTFDDGTGAGVSKCTSYTLSGDLNASVTLTGDLTADEINAGSATRSIVLSGTGEEDVTKTVGVTVTDRAGNIANKVEDSIVLDTQFLTGNIILRDKADTKNINNTWVNSADLIVRLALGETTAGDVDGYKIWGDINTDGGATATTEPASYTKVTKGTNPIDVAMKFTSGDNAAKNVYAKVIDDAGNETTLTAVLAKVDYTAPTVTAIAISDTADQGQNKYVSKVTGHTTAKLTPTFNADIAGAASYQWKMNGANFTGSGASGTGAPTALTVSSADMGDAGDKVFTLFITDAAGNTNATSASATVVLDTAAPTINIGTLAKWYNGDAADQTTYTKFSALIPSMTATDDKAGMYQMTLWCDTSATVSAAPSTAVTVDYKAVASHSDIDWTNHAESATNYIHGIYVDNVGNVATATSNAFGIDTGLPGQGTIAFDNFTSKTGDKAYNSVDAHCALTYSDSVSGVKKMKITGNISDHGDFEDVASAASLTLSTGDGTKNVSVVFKDEAGNISTPAATDSCELDTTAPSATLALFQDGKAIAAITSIEAFVAHVDGLDDSTEAGSDVYFKLYGDIATSEGAESGITEAAAEWVKLVRDSGQEYMTVNGYYLTKDTSTSGEGTTKTVYLKVRDNAGNIASTSKSTVLDESEPSVVVSNIPYDRISCVAGKRYQFVEHVKTDIDGTAWNKATFDFTPSEKIQAYKIVAYADQTAAENGSYKDAAIKDVSSSGAVYEATGLSSNAKVSALVMGADFRAALGGSETVNKDGAHFIVVYVQGLGTGAKWSTAAEFGA